MLLTQARQKLVSAAGRSPVSLNMCSKAALFALVACLMLRAHPDGGFWYDAISSGEYKLIRSAREQLRALYPSMPEKAPLLFLSDPFGDTYDILFLVRLTYRDDSLVINQLWRLKPAPDFATYDHVFQWRDGRWIELDRHLSSPGRPDHHALD